METNNMKTAHTPGPWIATEYSDIRDGSHGYEVGGYPDLNAGLAACVCSGPDCEANARLIAAAPELLDSLTDLLDAVEGIIGLDEHQKAKIQKARAAIAKAEGTT